MAKWYENIANGVTGFTQGLTDALGITDSHAPQRAVDAANSGMASANAQLYNDLKPQLDQLWGATNGRTLDANLDRFDTTMGEAMNSTTQAGQNALGEMNAGNADNVQSYLNPKMNTMLQNTMQTVQGGAGSALQSSATNRNVANAVASQAGQMWDTAFNQALGDSSHNLQANQQFGQSVARYETGLRAAFAGPDTVGFRRQESWEPAGLGGKLGAGRPPGSGLWVPPGGALTPVIALQTDSLLLQAERRALCACWPAGLPGLRR